MQPLPGPGRPRVPPLLDPHLCSFGPYRKGGGGARGAKGLQALYFPLGGLFNFGGGGGGKRKKRKKRKKKEKKKRKRKTKLN